MKHFDIFPSRFVSQCSAPGSLSEQSTTLPSFASISYNGTIRNHPAMKSKFILSLRPQMLAIHEEETFSLNEEIKYSLYEYQLNNIRDDFFLHVLGDGLSNISNRKVSMGVSPINLKKNKCSRHLSPILLSAGSRSRSLANRPGSSG